MVKRTLVLASSLCIYAFAPAPAAAQVPNLESIARQTFESRPVDVAMLRLICDQTDALRAQFGEGDPRVQDGELRANALKGMFTRRIAYAVHQLDPRFGLRRKDAGQRAVRPVDGLSLSTDVLLWRDGGQVIDVMSDRNASWLMTPGDVQPVSQWVEPLPEVDDAPMPPSGPPAQPPIVLPQTSSQPPPTPSVDYSTLLNDILHSQRLLVDSQNQLLTISQDTNQHVVNMDRTLTQTLGSLSKFVAKYIAPAIGGWYIAQAMNKDAPVPAAAK